MHKFLTIILLLSFALATVSCKDEEVKAPILFSGIVQDINDGEFIKNAQVILIFYDQPFLFFSRKQIMDTTITDQSGKFNFKIEMEDLSYNSYDLIVLKPDYVQTWCNQYPCTRFRGLEFINSLKTNTDTLKMGVSADFELKLKKVNVLNKDSISVSLVTQLSPSTRLIEPLISNYYSIKPIDTIIHKKYVYAHLDKLKIRYTIFKGDEDPQPTEINVDLIEKGTVSIEIGY